MNESVDALSDVGGNGPEVEPVDAGLDPHFVKGLRKMAEHIGQGDELSAFERAMRMPLTPRQHALALGLTNHSSVAVDAVCIPTEVEVGVAREDLPATFVVQSVPYYIRGEPEQVPQGETREWTWAVEGYRFALTHRNNGDESEVAVTRTDEEATISEVDV
jgi:hypothetical protein